MQVQSEVVLFQGSISRSGLGYVVDYILYISISGMYSINDMVRSILYFRNGYMLSHLCLVYWELFSLDG